MKKKSFAFPTIFIIIGGILLLFELLFLFLAVVFTIDGGHNQGNAIVLWAVTIFYGLAVGGGIPFLCIGISRAKAIRKYNDTITEE